MAKHISASSTLVVETAGEIMQGLIRSDMALRVASVERLSRSTVQPDLLVVPKMGAKLSFAVDLDESKEFLFGLFGERRRRPVADIRLYFELRPALTAPRFAIDPSAVAFRPPRFFRQPGAPGALEVSLSGGYFVSIDGDAEATGIELKGHGQLSIKSPWPARLVVALVDTLADWVKQGSDVEPHAIQIEAGTRLDNLLEKLYSGYAGIAEAVTRTPETSKASATVRRLVTTYPGLGGSYRLAKLAARVLVQLDGQGDLVTEADDPDWQQYDLEAEMVTGLGAPLIHLAMRPPDVLTEGRFHGAFLGCIREDDAVEQLRAVGNGWSEEAFREFIHDPRLNEQAIFVRIRHDDLDLVLLRGTLNGESVGLLYLVHFDVEPFPEVRVKGISSPKLIGQSNGDGEWQGAATHDTAIQAYFLRLFTVLLGWHRRMQLS